MINIFGGFCHCDNLVLWVSGLVSSDTRDAIGGEHICMGVSTLLSAVIAIVTPIEEEFTAKAIKKIEIKG